MVYFLAFCAVAVLGVAAVVGSGRLGELPPVVRDDVPPPEVAAGSGLLEARFDVVVRGYSMAQVDALLDRIAREWTPKAAAEVAGPDPEPAPEIR